MTVLKRLLLGGGVVLLGVGALAYAALWWRPINVNLYINKITLQFMLSSPELLTQIGAIDNTPLDFHSGRLASYTAEQDEKTRRLLRSALEGLDRYGPEGLEGQDLWSWKIAAWFFESLLRQAELDPFGYRVNQLTGVTIALPALLTDAHKIESAKSVERYLSRLSEFARVLREVTARVQRDREGGVRPPDFIIDKTLEGMRNFTAAEAPDNVLVSSLARRLEAAKRFGEATQYAYLARATERVRTEVIPAYDELIELFEAMRPESDHHAGIWRIPNGAAIYAAALEANTTTKLSADELHRIGLDEIARIQGEMDTILVSQGLSEGTVAERMQQLSEDPANLFSNDESGRSAMIAYAHALDAKLMESIGTYFNTLPPQPVEILRVPEYAEASSSTGYYRPPALDGSRPGRFYINQRDTAEIPRFALPTLMYHEASPGHHFQGALAQLIDGVPFLRTVPAFNAYVEGWALYSERLVAEDIGVYADDPLGDLGRLQMELFRATRLVVDTGLHAKRWSREQAVEYLGAQTGLPDGRVEREIDRYAVNPGQATGYKTGQLAILRMRERAERALGEEFNLRDFHDVLLLNGAMPLGVLDEIVDGWIQTQGSQQSR
ncbi:MAG: DUF885 domain-containing protein [Pseudomonadota bacterium]